jgi:hypothetical protein
MSAPSRLVWGLGAALAGFAGFAVIAHPLPPSATYRPLPTLPFAVVKANDEAEKPRVRHARARPLAQHRVTAAPARFGLYRTNANSA